MFSRTARLLAAAPRVSLAAARLPAAAPAPAPARAASTAASGQSVGALAYQLVFKRNVVYLSSIFVAAIAFDAVYGSAMKGLWASWNHGRTFGACGGRGGGAAGAPVLRSCFFFFLPGQCTRAARAFSAHLHAPMRAPRPLQRVWTGPSLRQRRSKCKCFTFLRHCR